MAVVGVVSLLIGIGIGGTANQPNNETASVAARGLPESTSTSVAPTTVVASVPAGEDTVVARIVDGDTIDVTGGTRIRLIGIDSPESTSTVECYGGEAAAKLGQLIPVGQRVRLVYNVERLHPFGRTLAYVYRLPDGEFVNLALAREGFAALLTIPPNLSHAEELRAAVAEAGDADRDLWSACPTTTVPPSTAAATVTTPPTRPASTPTTAAPAADGCHSSYAGACVPIASDVDCGGGAGNGPAYVYDKGFRVVGPDVYGLDRDNDGIACE